MTSAIDSESVSLDATAALVEILQKPQGGEAAVSRGSGVIVATDRVATVRHVVRPTSEGPVFEAAQLEVVLHRDGTDAVRLSVARLLVGDDSRDDAALLILEGRMPSESVALIDNAERVYGKSVVFTGYPVGIPVARTYVGDGYVAPGGVKVDSNSRHWLQINTGNAHRGMSGGPVICKYSGRVVGLLTERLTPDGTSDLRPTAWALNAARLLNPPFNIPFETSLGAQTTKYAGPSKPPPVELTLEQLTPPATITAYGHVGGPRRFIGRDDILTNLQIFWREDPRQNQNGSLVIHGLPWVGKSSVVGAFCEGLEEAEAAERPDLTLMHEFDEAGWVEAFFDMLRTLAPRQLNHAQPREIVDALTPLLQKHRVLVVLDAIEAYQSRDLATFGRITDPDLAYFVQTFQPGVRSRLILLSRVKPDLRVAGLPVITLREIGGLTQEDADSLYRAHMPEEPDPKWAELCEMLDHHPGGLTTILSHLTADRGLDLEWALNIARRPNGDDPLVAIENLLADMSDELSAEERTVMMALSQFSGDAAEAQLQETLEEPETEIDDNLFTGISRNRLPELRDRLEKLALLHRTVGGNLHVHAFVKRFFMRRFLEMYTDKQRNVHRRIANSYRARFNPPSIPTRLADLLPGLEAIIHHCKAGEIGAAWRFLENEVQGGRAYKLSNKLGAMSAFWRVLTHFFEDEDFGNPACLPEGPARDSLLHSVGYCQSVLGAQPWQAFRILSESARGKVQRGSPDEAMEVYRAAAYSAVAAGELRSALEILEETGTLSEVGPDENFKLLVQQTEISHMTIGQPWRERYNLVAAQIALPNDQPLELRLPRNCQFVPMLTRIGHLRRYNDLVEALRNHAQGEGWRDMAARHSSVIAVTSHDANKRAANAASAIDDLVGLGRVDLVAEMVTRYARYLIGEGRSEEALAFLTEQGSGLRLDPYPLLKVDFAITRCAAAGDRDGLQAREADCRRLAYSWGLADVTAYLADPAALLV